MAGMPGRPGMKGNQVCRFHHIPERVMLMHICQYDILLTCIYNPHPT